MTIFLKITRESGRVEHDCTHSFNSEEEARGHYDFLMKAGRDGHPLYGRQFADVVSVEVESEESMIARLHAA